jgi:hypothetical protein
VRRPLPLLVTGLFASIAVPASADASLTLSQAHRAAVRHERTFWGPKLYREYVTDHGCSRSGAAVACHFSLGGEGSDQGKPVEAKFLVEIMVRQDGHRLLVWERYTP